MFRGQGPAIRSDRPPSGFDAGEPAETRDELTIGQRRRRLAGDRPRMSSVLVARSDLTRQAFVDSAWTDDQQLVVRGQSTGDLRDEPLEVLESVRLTSRLRAAPATVPDAGIMANMSCGAAMSRHLGLHSFQPRPALPEADDDRIPRIDPYQGRRARLVDVRSVDGSQRGHERAHAGPASVSAARSA
jgi:hypothetical protein